MKLVIIHLDGLGFEYLKKSDLVFIKSLPGYLHRMKIYPGYFVNEVSLFTGTSPKNHQLEDLFILDPAKSPFKNREYYKILPRYTLRFVAYLLGYPNFLDLKMPRTFFEKFTPVLNHSPRELPDSFVSILKQHNLKFRYINSLFSNTFLIKKAIRKNDCVYIMDLTYDKLLHRTGIQKVIKTNIDSKIKNIFKFLKENYGDDFAFVLLSDHGMVDVISKIDISKVPNLTDKLYFADSTILRIWSKDNFFNWSTKDTELVESNIIDAGDYKHYKRYLAKPGFIFSPNFFQGNKLIKGMHGYKNTDSPHDAFMFIYNPKFKKQHSNVYCSIIDVAPTILKMFKILIPTKMEGNPLT